MAQVREEITLGGRKIQLEHRDVPIDEIRLDPENPRVGHVVRSLGKRQATDEKIREILWGTGSVKALARQIRLNGGLIERPILQSENGHFVVREGNCRATVYYKFHDQEPTDETWGSLPARVLPEDVDVKEIMRLLGDFHVAGKNDWKPFEKGAYIARMLEEFAFDPTELATTLRMSKTTLFQFKNAFVWMDKDYLPKYRDPEEGAERVQDFSHFLEFVKRVKEPTPELKGEFVTWVGTKVFPMAIQVRDLPLILETPGAKKALVKDGYHAAMQVVEDAHPERTSKLFSMLDRATKQLKGATVTDIEDLKAGEPAKVAQIKQLHHALQDLAALSNIDLDG